MSAKRWTIRRFGQGRMGRNGPVRVSAENGVTLPHPKLVTVQLSPMEKREHEFRNGKIWELEPGVAPDQIEAAVKGLAIKKRLR